MARGEWTQLDGQYNYPTAMAALGDRLYVAEAGKIWRVDASGDYAAISDDEWRSRFLVSVAGSILSFEESGRLYRIDPRDASYTELDGGWDGALAATAGGDAAYAISKSGTLYRVEPSDGSYTEFDGDYRGTTVLVAAGGGLITIDEAGGMYHVVPRDGTFEKLDDSWQNSTCGAGDDHSLFVAAAKALYSVDPRTGVYERLGEDPWNSKMMALMGGALFTIEPNGGLYRVTL
jgi:hypothetical protein